MAKRRSSKTISVVQAQQFNESMRQLLAVSDDAVARLEEAGAEEFVCTNYRQAVQAFSAIVKYVRDFAGASSTAAIETDLERILESAATSRTEATADVAALESTVLAKPKKKKN